MSKKVTNSISYIFNEMDPSEEVEFERELEQNSNLLIEVESLKKTRQRLEQLPLMNPPDNVVAAVRDKAARHSGFVHGTSNFPLFSAVAAVLIIGVTSGFFLLNQPQKNRSGTNQAGLNSVPVLPQSTMAVPASEEDTKERVTPWLDKNEVIHFTDRFQSTGNATFDSVFKNSFQKLTPVTDPAQTRAFQQNLQLTGSRPPR